jgi:glucosamine-6-phosphate deaminase
VLQLHPAATVVLDEAAAARLALREYYEAVHPGGGEAQVG